MTFSVKYCYNLKIIYILFTNINNYLYLCGFFIFPSTKTSFLLVRYKFRFYPLLKLNQNLFI